MADVFMLPSAPPAHQGQSWTNAREAIRQAEALLGELQSQHRPQVMPSPYRQQPAVPDVIPMPRVFIDEEAAARAKMLEQLRQLETARMAEVCKPAVKVVDEPVKPATRPHIFRKRKRRITKGIDFDAVEAHKLQDVVVSSESSSQVRNSAVSFSPSPEYGSAIARVLFQEYTDINRRSPFGGPGSLVVMP